MFFTCNLNRVSSLCTGLVHYITVGVHCVKTERYETETDGGTERQRQILSAKTQYLNKRVQLVATAAQLISRLSQAGRTRLKVCGVQEVHSGLPKVRLDEKE